MRHSPYTRVRSIPEAAARPHRRPFVGIDIPQDVVVERNLWESNPQFGQNVTVVAREAEQLVTVVNHDEHGPPRVWTIAVGIEYNADPRLWVGTGTGVNEIVGEILFGTGAGISRIEFDWTQGARLSVPANTLRILARVPGYSTSRLPETQVLTAVLAPGTTPRGLLPVWSRSIGTEAGEGPLLPIPPYASRVWVITRNQDPAIVGAFLELSGDPEGARILQTIPLSAAGAPGVRLLGGERFVRLRTPIALIGGRIVFELDT